MIFIRKVRDDYGFLGNMSPHSISYEGYLYKTSEHLFQVLRFYNDLGFMALVRAQASPMSAKMEAKRLKQFMHIEPRSARDVDNMKLCLQLKVAQHEIVRLGLKSTGSEEIVEDCTNRQTESGLFWGAAVISKGNVIELKGLNTLGRLWMNLRGTL